MRFHDPSRFTEDESARACLLRALEWSKWPAFLSQPLVPLLYLFFRWYWVLLGVFLVNKLWVLVRYRFQNVQAAAFGSLFVRVKWITMVLAGALFISRARWGLAALTAFTPLIVPILGLGSPADIGLLQGEFMRQLGYANRVVEPRSE
jgi:hypothetical protein